MEPTKTTAIAKQQNGNGVPGAGQLARRGFGEDSLQVMGETAAAAAAAQAVATIQARYIMAERKPRDWETARVRLLRDCQRPGFAEVARYRKPIGDGIVGPSIRFAEAALRAMGNVLPETLVTFDGETKRITRVQVTDLEANLTYSKEVVIDKIVERSNADGRTVLGERRNSKGKIAYSVVATDDELLNKQNALESKALRVLALRLLPGDILDECMAEVQRTKNDRAAKDPDVEKRRIIDAFAEIGVYPDDLAKYVGHSLDKMVPVEITELRDVYASVRDSEATWGDLLENKLAVKAGNAPTTTAPSSATTAPVVPVKAATVAAASPPATPRGDAKATQATGPTIDRVPAEAQEAAAEAEREAEYARKEAAEADRALALQEQRPVAGETAGNEPTIADVMLRDILKAATMRDLNPLAAAIDGAKKAAKLTINEARQLTDAWHERVKAVKT